MLQEIGQQSTKSKEEEMSLYASFVSYFIGGLVLANIVIGLVIRSLWAKTYKTADLKEYMVIVFFVFGSLTIVVGIEYITGNINEFSIIAASMIFLCATFSYLIPFLFPRLPKVGDIVKVVSTGLTKFFVVAKYDRKTGSAFLKVDLADDRPARMIVQRDRLIRYKRM